ncbi:MBL fold metallo-hydrolase [bacterium]|nr:MBL fold metallo-hydrolase [bacterium]
MKTSRRKFIGLAATSLVLAGSGVSEGAREKKAGTNQILNIYDNMVDNPGDAISQWGFSTYITYNGQTILFDAGTCPDILEHNAKALGADLGAVDIAVLSHSHSDHIFGFDYFLKVNRDFTFYVPNDFTLGGKMTVKVPALKSGSGTAEADKEYPCGFMYRHPNTTMVEGHTDIGDGIHLITTSSPLTGWFNKYPPNETEPLFIGLPELSLALDRPDGQVTLISGCSHSKIEEIVKETKKHLGKNVALVIGGFHHAPYSADHVVTVAKMLKDELGVRQVATSHCTGQKAVGIFKDVYKDDFLRAGLGSRLAL